MTTLKDEGRAVLALRRQVAVCRRRIQEHSAGDCPRGRDGCVWVAHERGILVGLLRALDALGFPYRGPGQKPDGTALDDLLQAPDDRGDDR